MVVRALSIVGLVVLMATGLASAATVERPLRAATVKVSPRFAIEIEASQTLSWSVDEKVPWGLGCGDANSENQWLAPRRGSGAITWTFTAPAVGSGPRLTAPARGSIQGTDGVYATQGAWEKATPVCKGDFPKFDELAPTSGCGPFASKGWADVGIVGDDLHVEAGVFHGFTERLRCPLLPEGKGKKLTPFNFALTSMPLTPQELSSGKEIRRAKTIEISETLPLGRGVYRTKQVNKWRVTMTPADQLRAEEILASSITVPHRGGIRAILFPPGTTATSFTFQMRRPGQSWTTLGVTGSPVLFHSFEVAGHFMTRTIADGARPPGGGIPRRLVTREKPLEVRFPAWADIARNQAVQSSTQELWRITLNLATPTARQEVGFWISLDTCSGRYDHTKTILGRITRPDEGAGLSLGPRPPDIPTNPDPVKGCSTYMVASFHTHTPTTYMTPGGTRRVGPSQSDEAHASRNMVPGGVFDYKAPAGSKGSIPAGYPKESPAQFYLSGLRRRPTP